MNVPRSISSRGGHESRRRGVALLMVLAVLVVVTTAIASAARMSMLARASWTVDRDDRRVQDLLNAAEAPILRWLNGKAHRVVLPPDVATPELVVLDDCLAEIGRGLRITAWDQSAMVPWNQGEAWLEHLPPSVAGLVERCRKIDGTAEANDARAMLERWATAAELDLHERACVVPRSSGTTGATELFGRAGDCLVVGPNGAEARPPAIGAFLATHNPRAGSTVAMINVCTAPARLLEAAFKRAGRGGTGNILRARAAGRGVALPELGERHDAAGFIFTTSSPCWSFRIDASAGQSRRSWWAVYARMDGQWQLVERWVVPA